MFKINIVILSILLYFSFNIQIIQASEWVQKDGNWYYQKNDDTYQTGWIEITTADNGPTGKVTTWYYCDSDGIMVSNDWIKDNEKWYYFNSNGEMEFNSIITDKNGKKYFVQRDGAMVEKQGWFKCAPQSYCYITEDGSLLINSTTPDGYTVDENGYWLEETTDQTTSSSNVNNKYSETVYKNIWDITTLYAKQQLKYPNTSIFPDYNSDGITIINSNGKWYITGWCQAKNGIGLYKEIEIYAILNANDLSCEHCLLLD